MASKRNNRRKVCGQKQRFANEDEATRACPGWCLIAATIVSSGISVIPTTARDNRLPQSEERTTGDP